MRLLLVRYIWQVLKKPLPFLRVLKKKTGLMLMKKPLNSVETKEEN